MQAVILAGGKGTRLRPLTENTPKSMVPLHGRPILEYTFEALPERIEEVVLVVGYRGNQIQSHFGRRFGGRRIRYAHQEEPKGTYHALATAKPLLQAKPFLCLVGDDLYRQQDLAALANHERAILVVFRETLPERFLACVSNERGEFVDIVSTEETTPPYAMYTGACMLTHEIFEEEIVYGPRGEQLLPFMIAALGRKTPVEIVAADFWFPIATPDDVAEAEEVVRARGMS